MTVWSEFQPLKSVVLGSLFSTNEMIAALQLKGKWRSAMQFLNDTAQLELEKIEQLLKNLNVEVHRTSLYAMQTAHGLASPPLAPRDNFLVYGNQVFQGNEAFALSQYRVNSSRQHYLHSQTFELPTHEIYSKDTLNTFDSEKLLRPYFHTANVLRCGQDIFVSRHLGRCGNQLGYKEFCSWIARNFPKVRIHEVNCEEHLDGSLFFVRPGLVLSTLRKSLLPAFFKKWTVVEVELNDTRQKIYKDFYAYKWKKLNPIIAAQYTHFLQCNPQETLFSLNALSYNDNTVIFPGYDKDLFQQLEHHNVKCVSVDMRALSFWDSGLHCCTNELERQGDCEDYT